MTRFYTLRCSTCRADYYSTIPKFFFSKSELELRTPNLDTLLSFLQLCPVAAITSSLSRLSQSLVRSSLILSMVLGHFGEVSVVFNTKHIAKFPKTNFIDLKMP